MNDVREFICQILDTLDSGMQSEHHVVAEIYHTLRVSSQNFKPDEIILEAPYPHDKHLKCDLVIRAEKEIWIEIKGYFSSETASTRSRKHTSERSSPLSDCRKLRKIDNDKIKVLFIYQNEKFEPIGKNSWKSIEQECNKAGILCIRKKCN